MTAVSVIIPTRNRPRMLLQTISTVCAQQVDLEIIVIDEGSDDPTASRIASLEDTRTRVIRHERPLGVSAARNAGIALASAEWVAFVDDDDLWLPDKLTQQLQAAQRMDAPWVFGGALEFADGLRLLHVHSPPATVREAVTRLPYANVVPGGGSNVLVKRDLLATTGGFDESANLMADWDLWIRIADIGEPALVDGPVVAYRLHPGNSSKRVDLMLQEAAYVEAKHRHRRAGDSIDWDDLYRWLGAAALREGDGRAARRLALRAYRAGHRGALRRLARALLPNRQNGTFSPIPHEVGWPGDTRRWIEQVVQAP